MEPYKNKKAKDNDYSTFDFRVDIYRKVFDILDINKILLPYEA